MQDGLDGTQSSTSGVPVSCCCCRLCLYLTIILPSQPKSSYTTNNTFVLLIANTTSIKGHQGPNSEGRMQDGLDGTPSSTSGVPRASCVS